MANRKQLAILKQGVAAWNKWREENPDAKINMRGAKLDELDLSGANFYGADIRGASFRKSILIGSNFSGATAGILFSEKILYLITSSLLIPIGVMQKYYFLILLLVVPFSMVTFSSSYNQKYFPYFILLIIFTLPIYLFIQNLILDRMKIDTSVMYRGTDFKFSDLTNSTFRCADMTYSSIDYSTINNTCFIWCTGMLMSSLKGTILDSRDVLAILTGGGEENLNLKGVELYGAYLFQVDLQDFDLRETGLIWANLTEANITGAKLWGTSRENWIIDGIRCDYIYWDEAGEQRTPPDRDFRPGEFEELYKQLPTFEYIFEQGFTPLDPLIMDRVVQAINERHKEFSLELVSFDKRGQPHATFTVCHLEHVEKAKQQIAAGYEESRRSPDQREQLMAAVLGLIENQNKLIDKIPSSRGLAMGDTYNIHGGQIGAVGQSASASGNTFQQITADLSRLHEEMQRSAKTPEQHAAAKDVAKAAQAAREQNEPAVRQHLKNAGIFALDCAQKIGAEALAEYLKKMTLGM